MPICKRDPILLLNSPRIQTYITVIYVFIFRILHTKIAYNKYALWIFTYRIIRLALEISF